MNARDDLAKLLEAKVRQYPAEKPAAGLVRPYLLPGATMHDLADVAIGTWIPTLDDQALAEMGLRRRGHSWWRQQLSCLRRAWTNARERKLHNDRDYECIYWWGDRGGYDYRKEFCSICNPQPTA